MEWAALLVRSPDWSSMGTPVSRMGLGAEALRAAQRSKLYTAEELSAYTDDELLTLRFMSKQYVAQISSRLRALGLQRPVPR